MVVYISGKITGNENYKAEFEEAQRFLEEQGCKVYNPANAQEGRSAHEYMMMGFAMIGLCDEIVMLPGYLSSKGAAVEKAYAEYLGKTIRYLYRNSDGTLRCW